MMTPLMGGLLVTSIASGILISRWGRYKVFPIFGTAILTFGLLPITCEVSSKPSNLSLGT